MSDNAIARRVLREIWPVVATVLAARGDRGEDLSALTVVVAVDGDGIDSMVVSRAEARRLSLGMAAFGVTRALGRPAPAGSCWAVVVAGDQVEGELVPADREAALVKLRERSS